MTYEKWFEEWLDVFMAHLKPSTRVLYTFLARKHILPILGLKRVSEVNAIDLQRFLNEAEGSPSLRHNLKAILSGSFKKAFQIGLAPSNPMVGVTLHAPIVRRIDFLSVEEQDRFSDFVADKRLGVLFHFLLATGLRVGEALALRWCSVDLRAKTFEVTGTVFVHKGRMVIQEPKTQQSKRSLAMMDSLYHELLELRFSPDFDPDGFVFVNPKTGEPFRQNYVGRLCRQYSGAAIGREVTPHVLRHTFATRAFDVGIDVKIISAILGHSGTQITYDTYVHASQKSIAQAMTQIEQSRSAAK